MMLAELDVSVKFTHLDTGANNSAWGKPAKKIAVPCIDADKIIFLHRDPRDTVVSYFHEATIRQKPNLRRAIKFWFQGRNAPKDIGQFVRSSRFGIEKVIRFNLLCAEHLKALPITYEDLRKNTVEGLSAIVHYVDCPVTEDRIREAVENNYFARMREREAENKYKYPELQARDPRNPNSFKVRRGKVGGWRDELNKETQEFVNGMLEQSLYFNRMEKLTWKQRSLLT
jgi:hypothetical protein